MRKRRPSQKERRILIESVVGKVPWDRFDAGIYNYCDRWCEKCNKTGKCYLFWSTQKEEKEFQKKGIDTNTNEGMLESVGNSLSQAKDLLTIIAEAEGIDLTITPEFEAEYEKREKLTDHRRDPVYKKAHKTYLQISQWLAEMPSLDIKTYHDAYDNLSWHHIIIHRKIARAISSKKEAELEKGEDKKFELEDSKRCAWMAYRSTKICAESLELMDKYVRDFRIAPMAKSCRDLLNEIDQKLL